MPVLNPNPFQSAGLAWDTAGFGADEERRAWHRRKMQSKVARPAAQMARLPGLPAGSVIHVDLLDAPL